METIRTALDRAWGKIQTYAGNFAGLSESNIEVCWREKDGDWDSFGVEPDGNAYFLHGTHIGAYHERDVCRFGDPDPRGGGLQQDYRYQCLEELIKNWKQVKSMFMEEVGKVRGIYSFEP